MIILIMGPQGSGKGTQAKVLAKKFNLFYVVAGDILREAAKEKPEIDEIVNKKGGIVDDDITCSLIEEYLEKNGISDNIMLDGFPRTVKQFGKFKDWLEKRGKKIDLVFLLEISDEEAVRRLSARRMNKKTGEIYNLITNPPGTSVKESDLVQREDDKEEAIRRRLGWYKEQVMPLIEVFKNLGVLKEIDGERPIEVVHKQLVETLEGLKK